MTATKTSLENKHLGNGDCFVLIASSSHLLLLTEHAANGLVEAPFKSIWRMIDLLLCVHVVVKHQFGNFTLSFGKLRQNIVLTCVPHVQHDYFFSFNQSDHCFLASSLPSSLLKVPICGLFQRPVQTLIPASNFLLPFI